MTWAFTVLCGFGLHRWQQSPTKWKRITAALILFMLSGLFLMAWAGIAAFDALKGFVK